MTEIQSQAVRKTLTVGELIALLSTYDPALRVGFSAGCCSYSHNVVRIRAAKEDETEDRHDIVVEVDG